MTNSAAFRISPCICRFAARWERIKTWLKKRGVGVEEWVVQQVAVADVAVGQKDRADMATLNRRLRSWTIEAIKAKKPDSTQRGSISTQCDPIRDPVGLNNG